MYNDFIGSLVSEEGEGQLAPLSKKSGREGEKGGKKNANENMKVKRAKKVTQVFWPVVARVCLSTALTQNTYLAAWFVIEKLRAST